MKQIQFEKYGPPARVAKCIDVADPPAPGPWEVSVDIRAAAVNPADISVLRGQYGVLPARLPATIGQEGSGVITAIGSEVKNVSIGDRVIMIANDNWCQRRTVRSNMVHKAPDWLDEQQAAMVKTNSMSALLMLRNATDLQPGDYLIQSAPLSAVGRMVIGMARGLGLHTVNIVRSEESARKVTELGGDIVLLDGDDLTQRVQEATDHAPIMLGLDAVAGDITMRMADCMEAGATLVNYGMLSAQPCQMRPDHTIFKNINLTGFWLAKVFNRMTQNQRTEALDDCLSLMAKHKLQNEVDKTFSLNQISEAIERAESPERKGKVILLPNGPANG